MRKIVIWKLLFVTLLVSCSKPSTYNKKNAELEFVVQKIKSDLESIKHDIRCQNLEMRMIEGKIASAQETLCVFKSEIMHDCQNKLIDLDSSSKSLKISCQNLSKEQKSMQEGLEFLGFKADTLSKSFNIVKTKVHAIEIDMKNKTDNEPDAVQTKSK